MYFTGAKSSPWILLYLPSENKFLQTNRQLDGNIYTVVLYSHLYRPVVDSVFIVAYLNGGGVLCLVLVCYSLLCFLLVLQSS